MRVVVVVRVVVLRVLLQRYRRYDEEERRIGLLVWLGAIVVVRRRCMGFRLGRLFTSMVD